LTRAADCCRFWTTTTDLLALTGPLTIGFTAASQPAWWIIAGCGLTVLGVGALTSGRWAVGTAARTAHLFEDEPAKDRPHRAA